MQTSWLRLIAPVAPPLELRLRDIFSLKHIGDAGEGGLGGAPPFDDKPRWGVKITSSLDDEWQGQPGTMGTLGMR